MSKRPKGEMPCPDCGRVGETCEECLASIRQCQQDVQLWEATDGQWGGQDVFHFDHRAKT